MSFDGMLRCKVVDTLPDVLGTIFLVPKEEKDKSGKTITVYEEYVFMKEQIGVVHPEDIESIVIKNAPTVQAEKDDIKEIIKERARLPYDAMGDYSNTPCSTGQQSPDEWYRENLGDEARG